MKPSTTMRNYKIAPLHDLLSLIAIQSDGKALRELLSNRKPYLVAGKRLDLSLFLREISSTDSSRAGRNQDLVDSAYDLTVDKFSHLPVSSEPNSTDQAVEAEGQKRRLIDCRNYYKAVLNQFEPWLKSHPLAGTIDIELELCVVLQRMVVKHFYWSLKECRRAKLPFARRYVWNVNDEKISLRRPVEIPGADFRKWLEENIADPDLMRPGEAMRIQKEVDRHFAQGFFVPWDDKSIAQVSDGDRSANPESTVVSKPEPSRLALTVATEKVGIFDTMRPAIRELGRDMLFLLITRIFQDIEDGIMEDILIANDFGLSKATFSRFAGSDWTKHIGQDSFSIPDLWLNTAKVLASSPEFTEIALSAGVLPQLKEVIKRGRNANV